MNIITGVTGSPHITADHDAMWHKGIWGDDCIIKDGSNMNYAIQSNNEIRIKDGICSIQGRFASIDRGTYDTVRFDNGLQGQRRIDLIVIAYEKNRDTNHESMVLKVKKGYSTTGSPSVPSYTRGTIGVDRLVETPLYEVHLSGLSITQVKPRLEVVSSITSKLDGWKEELIDYPILTGTWSIPYGSGTYIKYKSGRAELRGTRRATIGSSAWQTWGSLYYCTITPVNYPSGLFVNKPIEVQSIEIEDNSLFSSQGTNSATSTGNTLCLRPSAISNNLTPSINYTIEGRWK